MQRWLSALAFCLVASVFLEEATLLRRELSIGPQLLVADTTSVLTRAVRKEEV